MITVPGRVGSCDASVSVQTIVSREEDDELEDEGLEEDEDGGDSDEDEL